MTKLEAWKAWSATAGTDGSEFTLEKSSHGKAFSYAWGAAQADSRYAAIDWEVVVSEIKALPTRSTGYPPYQHSPDWVKQQAADIVQRQMGEQA